MSCSTALVPRESGDPGFLSHGAWDLAPAIGRVLRVLKKAWVPAFAGISGVMIALAGPALAAPPPALKAVIAEFDRFNREADPISAGNEGDRAALRRWPDDSPKAVAGRVAQLKGFRQRLAALKGARLADEDELNRAYLAWVVDDLIEGYGFDQEREPFSSDNGPFDNANYVARTTAVRTREDADAWLARLEALPAYYDTEIANARRGIATGFVQPRYIAEIVARTSRDQAGQGAEQSPLLIPLQPQGLDPSWAAPARARALAIVKDRIKPRERAYAEMIERDYLPAAKPSLAARSLPGGERYYAWLVRHHTTTRMTPEQIHELGEREVLRIRARMNKTMAEAGFKGSFKEFLAFLRSDPRFYVKTPEELLDKAAAINKRTDDKLPAYFGTLPRLTFGVRPVPKELEEGYTTARYWSGSPDQGVAGGYMVNVSHLDQRPLYELPALTLHESVPGHHLQIALQQERKDLPFFRRNGSVTAFVEGWGLYSEGLGEEMGIYRDPYELFGRLSMEMWRACRLVADTGVHWLGWTREQARACFVDNSALAPKNIDNELDRYISWPGQALAYKVGELKLVELRGRAKAALGPRFDDRSFHDQILLPGPLPLELLEGRMDRWIAREKAGH
jgi:uncharacterized protein (DUF885 family)